MNFKKMIIDALENAAEKVEAKIEQTLEMTPEEKSLWDEVAILRKHEEATRAKRKSKVKLFWARIESRTQIYDKNMKVSADSKGIDILDETCDCDKC